MCCCVLLCAAVLACGESDLDATPKARRPEPDNEHQDDTPTTKKRKRFTDANVPSAKSVHDPVHQRCVAAALLHALCQVLCALCVLCGRLRALQNACREIAQVSLCLDLALAQAAAAGGGGVCVCVRARARVCGIDACVCGWVCVHARQVQAARCTLADGRHAPVPAAEKTEAARRMLYVHDTCSFTCTVSGTHFPNRAYACVRTVCGCAVLQTEHSCARTVCGRAVLPTAQANCCCCASAVWFQTVCTLERHTTALSTRWGSPALSPNFWKILYVAEIGAVVLHAPRQPCTEREHARARVCVWTGIRVCGRGPVAVAHDCALALLPWQLEAGACSEVNQTETG